MEPYDGVERDVLEEEVRYSTDVHPAKEIVVAWAVAVAIVIGRFIFSFPSVLYVAKYNT